MAPGEDGAVEFPQLRSPSTAAWHIAIVPSVREPSGRTALPLARWRNDPSIEIPPQWARHESDSGPRNSAAGPGIATIKRTPGQVKQLARP